MVTYFVNESEDFAEECFMLYGATGEIVVLRSLMLEPCLASEFTVRRRVLLTIISTIMISV